MSRFSASDNRISVQLTEGEVAILTRVATLVRGAGVDKDDPARARLHPSLYPDDDTASREFDRLAAKERVEARSADREVYAATLGRASRGPIRLSPLEAASWVRVLGEARIVLAARKGLFETGLPTSRPSDPEVALVLLLGHLQEELVGELTRTMEDAT